MPVPRLRGTGRDTGGPGRRSGGGGGGSTKYVNRNVTVEVPKFYDRNVTENIEQEVIEEKLVYGKPNPLWFYRSIFVIGLCIIIGILYLRLKSNETKKYYKEV